MISEYPNLALFYRYTNEKVNLKPEYREELTLQAFKALSEMIDSVRAKNKFIDRCIKVIRHFMRSHTFEPADELIKEYEKSDQ